MKKAFTLAEILITLTIIGIVSAVALPTIIDNTSEKAWKAKKEALHLRMSMAITQLGDVTEFGYRETENEADFLNESAEKFLVEGLAGTLKIKNICDYRHIDKCGLPINYTNLDGSPKTLPTDMSAFKHNSTIANTRAAAFETANGDKVAVYYNPNCRHAYPKEIKRFPVNTMCVNFIYDLNGNRGPNTMGKDMGVMSVVYDIDKKPVVVAPNLYPKKMGNAPSLPSDERSADALCRKENKDLTLPDVNELISIAFNNLGYGAGVSRTVVPNTEDSMAWYVSNSSSEAVSTARTTSSEYVCVYVKNPGSK